MVKNKSNPSTILGLLPFAVSKLYIHSRTLFLMLSIGNFEVISYLELILKEYQFN
ncbi:hypothetical protein MUP32_03075 [Candidatus Microgenomates bacterium]|nr:hypothetical protein [Candidatus Microgenomates bacterium]